MFSDLEMVFLLFKETHFVKELIPHFSAGLVT